MDYPPTKTEPWSHQREAWRLASQHNAFYLAVDMGGGKSKMAIDYANGFEAHSVLIICPKSVIEVWPLQFDTHSAINYLMIGHDFAKSWSVAKRTQYIGKRVATAVGLNRPYCLVLNFESIFRSPLGPIRDKRRRIKDPGFLLRQNWDLIVVDEAHRIKAPGGEASWICKKLHRTAKRRLALSGTPMPHGPEDVYAQFRFLNPSIYGTNYTNFRARYCVMGGFENRQIVQYQNMDDFTGRFYSIAYRVKTRDVVDLPDEVHQIRYCELGAKIRKLYAELEKELITAVDGEEITVDNALVKLLRLSQMTSGYVKTDEGREEIIDRAKFKECEEVMTDLDLKEPLIVICKFRHELFEIQKICEKMGRSAGLLYGGGNQLSEFNDGQIDTLIVQIQAGNAGIDLTRSHYCIYVSNGSLGEYMQSLARTMRPGQKHNVTYIHTLARNTVDERKMTSLKERQKLIDKALKDNDPDALAKLQNYERSIEYVKDLLGVGGSKMRRAA